MYVAFDLLAGLSPTVANSVGEQVMAGLILVFQKHKDIIRYSFLLFYADSFIQSRMEDHKRNGILCLL